MQKVCRLQGMSIRFDTISSTWSMFVLSFSRSQNFYRFLFRLIDVAFVQQCVPHNATFYAMECFYQTPPSQQSGSSNGIVAL